MNTANQAQVAPSPVLPMSPMFLRTVCQQRARLRIQPTPASAWPASSHEHSYSLLLAENLI